MRFLNHCAWVVLLLIFIILAANAEMDANLKADSDEEMNASNAIEYAPDINRIKFVEDIDNRYLPLKPGTKQIYEAATEEGKKRNEVLVTNESRMILGVKCVVVQDTEMLDGDIMEITFDWYAQDENGNVWYFGEESKEYENGVVISNEGSWEAGIKGAEPGIVMQADPHVGDVYRQEYLKGEAEDMAQVFSFNESAIVPYGSFNNTLMIKEWTPLEPGVVEHKYYVPGIGMVLAVESKLERLELVNIENIISP